MLLALSVLYYKSAEKQVSVVIALLAASQCTCSAPGWGGDSQSNMCWSTSTQKMVPTSMFSFLLMFYSLILFPLLLE